MMMRGVGMFRRRLEGFGVLFLGQRRRRDVAVEDTEKGALTRGSLWAMMRIEGWLPFLVAI